MHSFICWRFMSSHHIPHHHHQAHSPLRRQISINSFVLKWATEYYNQYYFLYSSRLPFYQTNFTQNREGLHKCARSLRLITLISYNNLFINLQNSQASSPKSSFKKLKVFCYIFHTIKGMDETMRHMSLSLARLPNNNSQQCVSCVNATLST